MKNRVLIIIGAVVLGVIILAVIGKKKGWIGKGDIAQVAIDNAAKRSLIETVTASGRINPQTEVKLSSEVSGEIIDLRVKEGDSVRRGDLLCVVNPSIYEAVVTQVTASVNQTRATLASAKASLIQAKAAADNANRNYERNEKLHNDKVISDMEFEGSRLQHEQADANYATAQEQVNAASFSVKSAEAQLQQAQDNLKKTKIYAPMNGIVSLVNVKLGERVVGTAQMAGTEIIRIADLANMQAEVDVNENDVLRISLGDTAEVEVDAYVNKKFKAVVTQIAYSATNSINAVISTSQATNFTVKLSLLKDSYVDLIQPELGRKYPFRPGMSATVDIKTESRDNVLTVPIQSVTTREDEKLNEKDKDLKESVKGQQLGNGKKQLKEIVFVVVNDKVEQREVKTGIQDANYMEITSGLKEGEKVVKAPFKLISKVLKNGDLVKVVEEKDLFKDDKSAAE
ncbi:MAG: efflux RND transporter periplasmic adaptor subunit [Chitinophagales bacterium]